MSTTGNLELSAAAYDGFALAYDHFFAPEAATATLRALERLLLKHLPSGSTILELCCGTGELTRTLVDRNYRVTGIDNSMGMLQLAQTRVPGARFQHADIRNLQVASTYDAVISAYNSLPHITSRDDLLRLFRSVRKLLSAGGRFIFDLYGVAAYAERWRGSFCKVDEQVACIVRASYDAAARQGENHITIFHHDGDWKRTDVVLRTHCYSQDDLFDLLRTAGFRATVYEGTRDLGISEAAGREFWVCIGGP